MGIFDSSPLPSSPTSQRLETSSISPWAQPYVSSYLDRAQGLINQGPTGFQNQVYSSAQNMGMPQQFAMGTNLANQGGQGALSTAPMALNYGQMGTDIGQKGIGIGAMGQQYGMNAGQNYANQATNPYAVGAFMNPYIQQSLAPQLALLNQQQQLGAQGIAAKAVGQGAFGGNRATLAQGLNAQNYDLARQQAIGQGYNEAFRQAQQAQQFGSQLGLQGAMQGTQAGLAGIDTALKGTGLGLQGVSGAQQGYQGATQAGSALGNIGAQQGQYELAKLALQNQIANQQYNQPFQNLEFQRSMLSGLPVSSSSTQGFQAPPNALSQIAGLGATGLGLYGMGKDNGWWKGLSSIGGGSSADYMNSIGATSSGAFDPAMASSDYLTKLTGLNIFSEGGKVKKYAKGGKVNYATGGDIDLMPTDQLAPMMQNPNIDPMEAAAIQQELMIRARMASNPQTAKIMGGGLDTIPSGDMFRAAGGGIVAFAGDGPEGSVVKTKESNSNPNKISPKIKDYQSFLEEQIRQSLEKDDYDPYARSQAMQAEYAKDIKSRQAARPYETLLNFGLGALSGESPYAMANIGKSGINALQQYQKESMGDTADRRAMLQQQVEAEKSADARQTARQNAMQTSLGQMYTREIGLKNAGATAANAAASKAATEYNKNWNNFQQLVALEKNNLMNQKSKTFDYEQNPAKLDADAYTNVYRKMPPNIVADLKLPDPKTYAGGESSAVTPGSATPAALPMPASADKAVVGSIYNTSKGPAKWDGKQFIPVTK
jgi:hypothetical protein